MDPAVEAAIIAAGVGVLTLIGALYGTRKASKDTKDALNKQLTEQREALDRTLAEQRDRTLNERFATAADRLGSDKPAAVRLAAVHAMAGLADDWEENRQTCVDVLCAYLRMPYEPDPGQDAPEPDRLAFRASREVRHTVIRVITTHLKDGQGKSWRGLDLDFTGVILDYGDFSGAEFSGGAVRFIGAEFSSGTVDFTRAKFSGGTVSFSYAKFSGGTVNFSYAKFSGGTVNFSYAKFSGGTVNFSYAEFSGRMVAFNHAEFSGSMVAFSHAEFSGRGADFSLAEFSGGMVDFSGAKFSGGAVDFNGAKFSGGKVGFFMTQFSGSAVDFDYAEFFGGELDFSFAGDWSVPPAFPWTDTPPSGVKLPPTQS
jgi:uncharacterized protein YjbI with pentapeptide repeats